MADSTNDTWLGSLVPGPSPRVADPVAGLDEAPDRIGPYLVEELVGRGGMAAVYRCRDEQGEPVAVKWLHMPSPALEQRFALEIRALSRVQHRSVVRWLGQGSHQGRPYLVMEFLQGDDLRLWTHRARRLPPLERGRRVRALAVQLCEALSHLHSIGLVHRDVKPSNVLVLEGDLPVLTDFGVVKDLSDDGETAMGVVIGTLNYASPEQIRGEPVDARADLYGLGCTLYYTLTGRVPFQQAEYAELVMAHLTRAPTPPSHHDPTISADLEQVVLRLMAKDPQERYADAQQVVEALSATPSPAGVPLAGRKRALGEIAAALERVASGRSCVVQISGRPGTGKTWASNTLQEGAARRGLPFLEPREPAALEAALDRLSQGEPLLLVTELPDLEPDIHIRLEPLGRADLRRSVVAAAPKATAPADLAERLFRATGGLPVLLLPLLEQLSRDPHSLDDALPPIPVDAWLDQLDLDALELLQAIAVSPLPLSAADLEAITQVPAEEPLEELLSAGLVVAASTRRHAGVSSEASLSGRRYGVAAQAFALGAIERAPDVDGLRERVARVLGAYERTPGQRIPGLRKVHELLLTGDLQAAASELRGVEERQPERPVGFQLAQARLDWLSGRAEAARAGFAHASERARVGGRGHITALLGLGVLEQQLGHADDAMRRLEAAAAAAEAAGELDLEVFTAVQLTWSRALGGRPGPALKRCVRLVGVARALAHPVLECVCMEVQGRLLLEVGTPAEAARVLADLSALSHAAGLRRERWQAHVLRARASLDLDPASPTAASAATDRLLRVLNEPAAPDPLGFRALAHALLARAAARLGDTRTCRQASRRAEQDLGRSLSPTALIARMQLARAAMVSGDRDGARAMLAEVERISQLSGYGFLAWQARKLEAATRGADSHAPAALLEGLEPSWVEALTRDPEPR
jgi:serine/threonine protein kinase